MEGEIWSQGDRTRLNVGVAAAGPLLSRCGGSDLPVLRSRTANQQNQNLICQL